MAGLKPQQKSPIADTVAARHRFDLIIGRIRFHLRHVIRLDSH
jgi:hypothetical protein